MTSQPIQASDEQRAIFERARVGFALGGPKREFPATWFDDAKLTLDAPWLVKGMIGPGELGLIYGPSGCGKSFFALDIACHQAAGIDWRGHRVRPSLAVYVAAESGVSILRRFIAWRDRCLGEAREERMPLAIITRAVNLIDAVEVEALIEKLAELSEQAALPLGAITFDTVSRCMPGADENRSDDITRLIGATERIRDQLGAASILVHHSGKDASKGARGHSSLFAAADMVLAIDNHVAIVEKLRDGVAGQEYAFDLDVVELGVDSEGDRSTTCVVTPVTAPRLDDDQGGTSRMGKNKAMLYDTIRRLIRQRRKLLAEDDRDPAQATLLLDALRATVVPKKLTSRRFSDALQGLIDGAQIVLDGPAVTLPEGAV